MAKLSCTLSATWHRESWKCPCTAGGAEKEGGDGGHKESKNSRKNLRLARNRLQLESTAPSACLTKNGLAPSSLTFLGRQHRKL